MSRIRAWYRGRSDAAKAALNSAWQSFAGVFGLAVLSWLFEVEGWAKDMAQAFPTATPLVGALVGGLASAATGLVTYVFRVRKPGPIYLNEP